MVDSSWFALIEFHLFSMAYDTNTSLAAELLVSLWLLTQQRLIVSLRGWKQQSCLS
jgi:hypothetical protein